MTDVIPVEFVGVDQGEIEKVPGRAIGIVLTLSVFSGGDGDNRGFR